MFNLLERIFPKKSEGTVTFDSTYGGRVVNKFNKELPPNDFEGKEYTWEGLRDAVAAWGETFGYRFTDNPQDGDTNIIFREWDSLFIFASEVKVEIKAMGECQLQTIHNIPFCYVSIGRISSKTVTQSEYNRIMEARKK